MDTASRTATRGTSHLRCDVNKLASGLRTRGLRAISNAHRVNKTLVNEIGKEIRTAKAEADEFIQSPHLLFRPIRMITVLLFPLIIPLFFIPFKLLCCYVCFCILWYFICLCYFATEIAMRPPWYKRGLTMLSLPTYWKGCIHNPKFDLGLDYESVEFPSIYGGGDILRGWVIQNLNGTNDDDGKDYSGRSGSGGGGRNWVICIHGAGRDRRAFLRHSKVFVEEGYCVLLFDTSEHGLSDCSNKEFQKGTAFGEREKYDVISAIRFIKYNYYSKKIALVGTSAGASSAILAAATNYCLIDAVIAENPFMRPDLLFQFHLSNLLENYLSENRHRTARRFLFWLASRVLMIRIGQYIKSYGAIDAAPLLKCPLLIAHSQSDDIVPFSHGLAIYEAAAKAKKGKDYMVQMYKVEDCAHCALFDKEPQQWSRIVLDFLERSLKLSDKD